MKVCCIDCSNMARPKNETAGDVMMLRAGFASCVLERKDAGRWLATMFPRECRKFSQSPDSQKRRDWLKKWEPK